jgi:hypothetical protein
MTNLAPVLAKLREAIATESEAGRTWAKGALIACKADEKGAEIAYLRADAVYSVINEEDQEVLLEKGYLLDEGKLQTVRAGKNDRVKALGIKLGGLQKAVSRSTVESTKVASLQEQNKNLERQLRQAQSANVAEQALADLLNGIREQVARRGISNIGQAVKFNRAKAIRGRALAGIPTLMLSDWHVGEVVDPEQVQHLNEYSLDIAFRRAERVFNTSLELLFHHQAGQSYDGFTLAFAGDMLSGNVHDELRRTNEKPLLECVMDLAHMLVGNIIEVSKNFEWVYVPCVAGNHGRAFDKKPSSKDASKENFDTHLYRIVAALVEAKLKDKCNVQFDISEALDMRYDLYGTGYLLTHGDQIQCSTGNAAFWPSLVDIAVKKQNREVHAKGKGFDYMLCGHFHRYGTVSNVIVNGSLKGYDEWVYRMNYEPAPPVQALWITHPDYGIIEHRPVYADEITPDATSNAQPVTTYRSGLRVQR